MANSQPNPDNMTLDENEIGQRFCSAFSKKIGACEARVLFPNYICCASVRSTDNLPNSQSSIRAGPGNLPQYAAEHPPSASPSARVAAGRRRGVDGSRQSSNRGRAIWRGARHIRLKPMRSHMSRVHRRELAALPEHGLRSRGDDCIPNPNNS